MMKIAGSVLCTLVMYIIGSVIEVEQGVNMPGLGLVLAVVTMGSIILHEVKKRS